MLTTIDNPYSPFDQFKDWYMFDAEKGYNTCAYINRLSKLSDDMTQDEVDAETDRVIDSIIETDPLNIYVKVYEDQPIVVQKLDYDDENVDDGDNKPSDNQ